MSRMAPPPPRPYRITVAVNDVRLTIPVWAYNVEEAVYTALVKAVEESGGAEGVRVVDVTPDLELLLKTMVGV